MPQFVTHFTGKTTILNMIAGLLPNISGKVYINEDQEVDNYASCIGKTDFFCIMEGF